MQLMYCFVSCVGILALLILEQIIKKSDTVSLSNTRLFKYAICTIIVVMISEIITVFLEGAPAIYFIPHVIGNALGFALSPLIPIQLGCAIGGCRNKKLLLFAAPVFLNMLLSILSPFFPIIFRVTDTNEYMRGSAFIIYVIAYSVRFCRIWYHNTGDFPRNTYFMALHILCTCTVFHVLL